MDSKFENSFKTLSRSLWSEVEPTPLENPRLAAIVSNVKEAIGGSVSQATDARLLSWLCGLERFAGDQRISTCYAGHQFGVWAGQLGDGRAMSLGEIINENNQRFEVQVKGLGKTPYSRMGDGRAVIRSSVREFLCAEYLHGLGVPTTRSLALIISDTPVKRESIERAAIVARVFPSQVRFGHFEFLYHSGKHEELRELIEYVRTYFMPGFSSIEDWFTEVVRRTAKMIAHWQAIGFCHGVMNTDNMSILGITIDYGPFGFLNEFNTNYVINHSDHDGRYSFGNQPRVALWNLQCLASCLLPFVHENDLTKCLDAFEPALTEEYMKLMARKLRLQRNEEIVPLVSRLLEILESYKIDYHFFFAKLNQYGGQTSEAFFRLFTAYPQAEELRRWFSDYDLALSREPDSTSTQYPNPTIVLRTSVLQSIIGRVESNDFSSLKRWLEAIQNPFKECDELSDSVEIFSGKDIALSCSS